MEEKMSWITLTLESIPEEGDVVNKKEVFRVRGTLTNNFPFNLTDCEWHLLGVSGPAKVYPAGDVPVKMLDADVAANGGKTVQDFALKADDNTGTVQVALEYKWKLGGTTLTYPVTGNINIQVHVA